MAKIADALKKLIENPDDLTTLPALVAQVEEMEAAEEGYLERIGKLQDLNKKYLAQIPIPGTEEQKKEDDEEPTIEDAKAYLIEKLGGGN